jgi:hypothetical protein
VADFPRRCPGSMAGLRCAGVVEVVLISPNGLRFARCRACAESAVSEYAAHPEIEELRGWSIAPATMDERGLYEAARAERREAAPAEAVQMDLF